MPRITRTRRVASPNLCRRVSIVTLAACTTSQDTRFAVNPLRYFSTPALADGPCWKPASQEKSDETDIAEAGVGLVFLRRAGLPCGISASRVRTVEAVCGNSKTSARSQPSLRFWVGGTILCFRIYYEWL